MKHTTTIKIKKLNIDAHMPAYAHEGDAGIDMYANEDKLIGPGQVTSVSTGICFELQPGYVALVWDKSGLALNAGIKTMAGVIDSGYRGEIKIVLFNTTKQDYIVKKNQKIAQILIQKVEQALLIEDMELTKTERGGGGFGSTGLN